MMTAQHEGKQQQNKDIMAQKQQKQEKLVPKWLNNKNKKYQ